MIQRGRAAVMRQHLTNVLLLVVALLLAANLIRPSGIHAASTRVRVQTIPKAGTVDVDGEVVGFSCVNKGAYTECSVAIRNIPIRDGMNGP
jgi:hypothetical protein